MWLRVEFTVAIAALLNACALTHSRRDAGGPDVEDRSDAPPPDVVPDAFDAQSDVDSSIEDADDGSDASDATDVAPDAGPILWSADFTALPAGAAPTLPASLVLRRASAATVQTGTSTVVTQGIGPDIARIGRPTDADPLGMIIEEGRTNLIADGRDLGTARWQAGSAATVTLNVSIGPDGANSADSV